MVATKTSVIIIYNKCDQRPELWRDGKPVANSFKNELFNNGNVQIKELNKFIYDRYRSITFMPFQAASFDIDGTGIHQMRFIESNLLPKALWKKIVKGVEGKPWWWIF